MEESIAKLIFVAVVIEVEDSPAPTLWSSLLSPPIPPPLALGKFFLALVEKMVVGFHPSVILPCLSNL